MPRSQPKGPSSFGEWIVGTTIESALGPIPKKKKPRRNVFKVELSTDDEADEDSFKITYPRTGKSALSRRGSKRVKKVRFEEKGPRKSALKKTYTISSESEDDTSGSDTDTSAASESDETSNEGSDEPEKSGQFHNITESSGSEEDSEPHPTCACSRCIKGRRQKKKQRKAKAKRSKNNKESDTSDTSQEESADENSETEGTASEASEKEEEQEEEPKARKKKEKNKKKAESSSKGQNQSQKAGKEDKKKVKNKDKNKSKKEPVPSDGPKNGLYPEALPGPHPRRPQYIEPVRAEVVQTERVIETAQDPPPNAYYDAANNIIRVYHGPTWGGNPNASLYPRRDPTLQALPVGVPHPTHNPYYHGFKSALQQGQPDFNPVPITQGLPAAHWAAVCDPPGLTSHQQDGAPGDGLAVPEPRMTKGAWSARSTQDKDKAGLSNVGPKKSASLFSGMGRSINGRGSNAGPSRQGSGTWGGQASKAASETRFSSRGDNNADWNASSGQDNTATEWGASSGQDNTATGWGDSNEPATQNNDSSWDNTGTTQETPNENDQNNGGDGWGSSGGTQNDQSDSQNQDQTVLGESNVAPPGAMPGAWGDTEMAADTGGQVDAPGDSNGW